MTPKELRSRWIHLDFHTSELIENIGAEFDGEEFASTLEKAGVDSITCFARCHHGWIYFDTAEYPERRHPHLTRDLLREQIDACHAHNIKVPIYVTVQWDNYSASRHPEWLALGPDGKVLGTPPYEAGFYRELCINSPYRDFLKGHVREILQTLPTDGFFFDIVRPLDCSCMYCRAKMAAQGVDAADPVARKHFGLESLNEFKRDMTQWVRQFNANCLIFYNAGHIGPRHRAVAEAYTHFELESLPSGGWGYLHFPITQRYARTLGLPTVSHTGKFHTSWGDFHSFKNPEALQYECFRMLALGSGCAIGDQLHPSGKIDPYVYELVGSAYNVVAEKVEWHTGATAISEIAVLNPEEFYQPGTSHALNAPIMGAERMLDESGHQFDIIDSSADLSKYKVLVLPDEISVSPAFAARLQEYLAAGGALIASYASGLNEDRSFAFARDVLGVNVVSDGPRDLSGGLVRGKVFPRGDYAEYVLPIGPLGLGLPPTEHVMYMRGMDVAPEAGTEVLAPKVLSYFDRTYQHYCSHRQSPSSGKGGGPAITRRDRVIYFAHPIFSQYNQNAPRWVKRLFLNALQMLLPQPLVTHDGPSTLLVTLNEQAAADRWVLHALHYIPERRSADIDIIEDVIPVYRVGFVVRAPRPVKGVRLVPEGRAIDFSQTGESVRFVVSEVHGHQMVEIAFA